MLAHRVQEHNKTYKKNRKKFTKKNKNRKMLLGTFHIADNLLLVVAAAPRYLIQLFLVYFDLLDKLSSFSALLLS